MEQKDALEKIRQYNKKLSVIGMSPLESALYKDIEEKKYFYSFSYIRDKNYVNSDAADFLRRHHHFSHLIKTAEPLLEAWLNHIHEYSFARGYLRVARRSRDLSDHWTYLLSAIGSFYLFEGCGFQMKELIYGQYRNLFQSISFAPVIAGALLLGQEDAIQYCRDVLLSENNTAALTRDVIVAIEMSKNEELWDLLLKVFLAAKLQEGLRQMVAESCDENQIGFFIKTIQVIDENNLLRYSSVQRAVFTWCALGTDNITDRDARVVFDLFKKYAALEILDNGTDTDVNHIDRDAANGYDVNVLAGLLPKLAMASENPLEIYMAMYALGMRDTQIMTLTASSWLTCASPHMLAAILTYLHYTGVFESSEFMTLFDNYPDNDWMMALFFIHFGSRRMVLGRDLALDYMKKFEQYIKKMKAKVTVHTKGFEWLSMNLEKSSVAAAMYRVMDTYPEKEFVNIYLPYAKEYMPYREFEKFFDKTIKKADVPLQKAFYIQNITDYSDRIQKVCEDGLLHMDLSEGDIIALEDRLKTKKDGPRARVMRVLSRQKPDGLKATRDRLAGDKNTYKIQAARELERKFPEVFLVRSEKIFYTAQEGFGLYKVRVPEEKPRPSLMRIKKQGFIFKKEKIDWSEIFPCTFDQLTDIVRQWSGFFVSHENDSWRSFGTDYLVKDHFRKVNYSAEGIDAWPLADVWKDYFREYPVKDGILFALQLLHRAFLSDVAWTDVMACPEGFEQCRSLWKDIPYYKEVLCVMEAFWENTGASEQMPAGRRWYMQTCQLFDIFLATYRTLSIAQRYGNRKLSIYNYPLVQWMVHTLEQFWGDDGEFTCGFGLLYEFYRKCCVPEKGRLQDMYRMSPLMLVKAQSMGLMDRDAVLQMLLEDLENVQKPSSWYYPRVSLTDAYGQAYFHGRNAFYAKPDLCVPEAGSVLDNSKALYSPQDVLHLRGLLDEIARCFLNMEMHRIHEETPVTPYMNTLRVLIGFEYIEKTMAFLGTDEFSRQTWGNSKKQIAARLVRHTWPGPKDSPEVIGASGISDERLIEICMLSTQWIPLISKYLGWDGFEEGCYYFIAHMKDEENDAKKAAIARFTSLEPEDLKDGAFDMQWCRDVYEKLGEKRFMLLYKSARFLCDNSFHTRARKYADACLGRLDKEKVLAQVKEKRNKDLLNAYCIIPLENKEDLTERYLYLQQFLKESRQFGSQRQASEKRAVEVAVMNLARNSSYEDATRLTWAMESWVVARSLHYLEPEKIEDYEVFLEIDSQGKNRICVTDNRGSKPKLLKSVPAKLKKNERFLEIQKVHKQWSDLHSRSRMLLEKAMEERTVFPKEEFEVIMKNPVVAPMLEKLLVIEDGAEGQWGEGDCDHPEHTESGSAAGNTVIGWYRMLPDDQEADDRARHLAGDGSDNRALYRGGDGSDDRELYRGGDGSDDRALHGAGDGSDVRELPGVGESVGRGMLELVDGTKVAVGAGVRIAHPMDLYREKCWSSWQKAVFAAGIVQPFKQVFRELYLLLEDELDQHMSKRYSGYQIQVKKAVAALKSRGWNCSYESGLEKVYYKENLIVNLYAEADWFSPSDIEAPCVDYVMFSRRSDGKYVNTGDISPIVYSEAMRDLDMAVSVAYVGGVDPLTSFSTIQLRSEIVRCTCGLMKLNNVAIEGNFAVITGIRGEYSVHLGSGVVHQKAAGQLYILPVHSQKRGKLYLPFIDEDPKCQEIVSKIVLLAEDGKIKDPTILGQIKPM